MNVAVKTGEEVIDNGPVWLSGDWCGETSATELSVVRIREQLCLQVSCVRVS